MQKTKRVPQMIQGAEGHWSAVDHRSFLGWEIISVDQIGPLICQVLVERKRNRYVIGRPRERRMVLSHIGYVPHKMYVPGELFIAGNKRYYAGNGRRNDAEKPADSE